MLTTLKEALSNKDHYEVVCKHIVDYSWPNDSILCKMLEKLKVDFDHDYSVYDHLINARNARWWDKGVSPTFSIEPATGKTLDILKEITWENCDIAKICSELLTEIKEMNKALDIEYTPSERLTSRIAWYIRRLFAWVNLGLADPKRPEQKKQ